MENKSIKFLLIISVINLLDSSQTSRCEKFFENKLFGFFFYSKPLFLNFEKSCDFIKIQNKLYKKIVVLV